MRKLPLKRGIAKKADRTARRGIGPARECNWSVEESLRVTRRVIRAAGRAMRVAGRIAGPPLSCPSSAAAWPAMGEGRCFGSLTSGSCPDGSPLPCVR